MPKLDRHDFLIAIALANLSLLKVWHGLLKGPSHPYFLKRAPSPGYWVAALILMAALTGVFLLGRALAKRSASGLRRLQIGAFLGLLILPLDYLRLQIPWLTGTAWRTQVGTTGSLILLVMSVAGCSLIIARWPQRVWRSCKTVVLLLWPWALINTAQAVTALIKADPLISHPQPAATRLPDGATAGRRVVWILFDELEYRTAFAARPAGLRLPELDRFRTESLSAEAAYPPSDQTLRSMPALTTGQLIKYAEPATADDLWLDLPDGKRVLWSSLPNVFGRARELGAESAVVGWYHPYSRVLGRSLVSGYDVALDGDVPFRIPRGTWAALADEWRLWWRNFPGFPILFPDPVDHYMRSSIGQYQELRAQALSLVRRPEIELSLLHFSVPHPRAIYNRQAGRFATERDVPAPGYLDNLALVDRTLGEIRAAMTAAGLWDRTTVIITSDHWWRRDEWISTFTASEIALKPNLNDDQRVPYMLKLPGQRSGQVYRAPFNTVLHPELILALLRGDVRTVQQAIHWLDAHRTFGRSPYAFRQLTPHSAL